MGLRTHWKTLLLGSFILTAAYQQPSTARADSAANGAGSAPFQDLAQVAEHKQEAIRVASQLGLIDGFNNGEFRPNETLTREQLSVLLAKALKLPLSQEAAASFADVALGNWSAPYIEAVRQAGLMEGDGKGFRPLDPVTREELAAVFVRTVQGQGTRGGLTTPISDKGSVSGWASQYVDSAVRLSLVPPEAQQFQPAAKLLRQDIAQFLIDIFPERERSAVVTKVEGDVITIDGMPLLVDPALKALLLNEANADTLEGAVLKFKSAVRSVKDLSQVEIVKGGTADKPVTLDTTGLPQQAALKLNADYVALQGGPVEKLVVSEQVTSVTIDAPVNRLEIASGKTVRLSGTGTLAEVVITDPKVKVELDPGMKVKSVVVADGLSGTRVVHTVDPTKQTIHIGEETTTTPTPSAPTEQTTPAQPETPPVVQPQPETPPVVQPQPETPPVVQPQPETPPVVQPQPETPPVVQPQPETPPVPNDPTPTVPQNQLPYVNTAIADQEVDADASSVQLNLSDVFRDADNDGLIYTAVSSDPAVASVSIMASSLSLSPVNAGTATVTVTAEDGKGGTVQTTFTVTVNLPAVNGAPEYSSSIEDLTMTVGDPQSSIDLTGFFSDPDGDPLTRTADSSDSAIVSVAVQGETLYVSAMSAGSAVVTITADDGKGGTTDYSFSVTVNPYVDPNHLPELAGTIIGQTLTEGGANQTIDLTGLFTDQDGDTLMLSATSTDTGVVTTSVNGSELTLIPVGTGTATINVFAFDGTGTTSTSFDVTVQAAAAVEVPSLFFTETIWSENDDLALEIYNPTNEAVDLSRISIGVQGSSDVSLSEYTVDKLNAGQVLVIKDIFFLLDEQTIYDNSGGNAFVANLDLSHVAAIGDSIQITLKIDDVAVDTIPFYIYSNMVRNTGLSRGNTSAYDASEWSSEPYDANNGDGYESLGTYGNNTASPDSGPGASIPI